jgi:hypothetical protein
VGEDSRFFSRVLAQVDLWCIVLDVREERLSEWTEALARCRLVAGTPWGRYSHLAGEAYAVKVCGFHTPKPVLLGNPRGHFAGFLANIRPVEGGRSAFGDFRAPGVPGHMVPMLFRDPWPAGVRCWLGLL